MAAGCEDKDLHIPLAPCEGCEEFGIQRKEKTDLKHWTMHGCSKCPEFCLYTDAKKITYFCNFVPKKII